MRSHSENVLRTHYRFYIVLAFHTKTLDFNKLENITTTLFAMRQILLNHVTLGFSPIFYCEHDMGRDQDSIKNVKKIGGHRTRF